MNNIRTIRVMGKGMIRLKPDLTKLMITLEGVYKEYSESVEHSSKDTESLKELLSGFGFEKSDLKTIRFDVNPEYESYEEKNVYKERLVGYKYTHTMKVEFDPDNERLGKILYALAYSELHPTFSISYTVKDPEAAKNELLGKAVKDAKEKAAVLAAASDVTLKEIQRIDYSWGDMDFEVRPMNGMVMDRMLKTVGAGSFDMDIEPDDIEVSDTVTIVWEIA